MRFWAMLWTPWQVLQMLIAADQALSHRDYGR
jgi:hypothetical protein